MYEAMVHNQISVSHSLPLLSLYFETENKNTNAMARNNLYKDAHENSVFLGAAQKYNTIHFCPNAF